MGLSTGEVLDYTMKNKMSRSCDEVKKVESNQKTTTVEKNHSKPLAVVELFKKVTQSNIKFSIYTGDDDSTTEFHSNLRTNEFCSSIPNLPTIFA